MKSKIELIRIIVIILLLATIIFFFLNGTETITYALAITTVLFSFLYQLFKHL